MTDSMIYTYFPTDASINEIKNPDFRDAYRRAYYEYQFALLKQPKYVAVAGALRTHLRTKKLLSNNEKEALKPYYNFILERSIRVSWIKLMKPRNLSKNEA
nr:hypothetical protein [Mycoplasmopsis bovis]